MTGGKFPVSSFEFPIHTSFAGYGHVALLSSYAFRFDRLLDDLDGGRGQDLTALGGDVPYFIEPGSVGGRQAGWASR